MDTFRDPLRARAVRILGAALVLAAAVLIPRLWSSSSSPADVREAARDRDKSTLVEAGTSVERRVRAQAVIDPAADRYLAALVRPECWAQDPPPAMRLRLRGNSVLDDRTEFTASWAPPDILALQARWSLLRIADQFETYDEYPHDYDAASLRQVMRGLLPACCPAKRPVSAA